MKRLLLRLAIRGLMSTTTRRRWLGIKVPKLVVSILSFIGNHSIQTQPTHNNAPTVESAAALYMNGASGNGSAAAVAAATSNAPMPVATASAAKLHPGVIGDRAMTRHNSVSSVGSNQFDMLLRHSTASVSCSPPLNPAAAVNAATVGSVNPLVSMASSAVGGPMASSVVGGPMSGHQRGSTTGDAATQTDECGPPMSWDLTVR